MDFFLYRPIHQNDAQYFNQVLQQAAKEQELNLFVHCVGGNVFEGTAMHNSIKRVVENGLTVTATIEGVAASMAIPIVLSCSRVRCRKSARLMIHEIKLPNTGGNAQKMRANAEMIESWNDSMAGTIAAKTNQTKEFVRENWMKPDIDLWFTAEEALQVGLIDEIIEDSEKLDAALLASLQPEELTGTFDAYFTTHSKTKKVKMEQLQGLCNDVGFEMPEGVTDLQTGMNLLKIHVQGLTNENTRLTAEVEAAQLKELNGLMEMKGIPTGQRANYIKVAKVISHLHAVNLLGGIADMTITLQSRADWDYSQWQKEDPKGLLELKNREPQKVSELVAKY